MKSKLAGLIALLSLTAAALPAGAQKLISVPDSERGSVPQAAAPQSARDIRPGGPAIRLRGSEGTMLRLPDKARTVFVADPEVADVQVQPEWREFVFINAKRDGRTVLYAVGEDGSILLNSTIDVGPPPPTIIKAGTLIEAPKAPPTPNIYNLVIPLQPAAPAQ